MQKPILEVKNKYKKNAIIQDHGSWLEIDVSTKKYPHSVMKIDRDDLHRLESIGICRMGAKIGSHNRTKYAFVSFNGKNRMVHKILFPDYKMIDHKNGDGLDNRKENIRPCTPTENARNITIKKNNTSSKTGVSWNTKKRRWISYIKVNNFHKQLIVTFCFKKACEERDKAEEKLFGEFSRLHVHKQFAAERNGSGIKWSL